MKDAKNIERVRKWQEKQKSKGLCIKCSNPANGLRCDACNKRRSEYRKRTLHLTTNFEMKNKTSIDKNPQHDVNLPVSERFLDFEEWFAKFEDEINIELAETGADREMDFDCEREFDNRYEMYLNNR